MTRYLLAASINREHKFDEPLTGGEAKDVSRQPFPDR